MTTQDTKSKSKLLYLTLAVPALGASLAFAFGDPQCLADLTGDPAEDTDTSDPTTPATTVLTFTTSATETVETSR
jgi:hypothetical protein